MFTFVLKLNHSAFQWWASLKIREIGSGEYYFL